MSAEDPRPAGYAVTPTGPLSGAVAAPASKSVTIRLLIQAALADGTSTLRTPLISDDSAAVRTVISGLGAAVWESGDAHDGTYAWHVAGTGGRVSGGGDPLDCRLSGTTMRLGTAVAALADRPVRLTGGAPLLRRPIGPLCAALRDLGADVTDTMGMPPVTASGGLVGGTVHVDVTGSSQYASAVLLAAPYAAAPTTVVAQGDHAAAYVDLTAATMEAWGIDVRSDQHADPRSWTVQPGRYEASDLTVEYDASAACHLYALAVATGGSVTVVNVTDTIQPDAKILDVLAAFGASVQVETAGPDVQHVTVTGPDRPVALGTVDLTDMPDQVTTVAALAALAEGPTTITGVEVVRGHETDRVAALATELTAIGAAVVEHPDGLTVDGSSVLDRTDRVVVQTYHDHRLGMAFGAVAARRAGVVVADPMCVDKTFPDFWKVLVRLGGELHPVADLGGLA